jgi:hypothetical protein
MTAAWVRTADVAILAAWLGAAIFLAAAVAPAGFAVLPSRTLAGALVGRVLPPLFYAGMLAAIVSGAIEAIAPSSFAHGARLFMAGVMLLSCAVGQFIVAPRIDSIRSAIPGTVESLATDDPRRVLFGRLHAFSVGWLGLAMLAALASIVLAARASSTNSSR